MLKIPPTLLANEKWRGRRIGLLGGSFNPAHAGHVHISLIALKEMKLDAVWWLVSPQNPLKSTKDMASFAQRYADAVTITSTHPALIVSDLEMRMSSPYTAQTLKKLKHSFPRTRFVWLMGADNLLQITRWQRWRAIFRSVDVAVFRRPSYDVGVLRGKAAQRFSRQRLDPAKAKRVGRGKKPVWILFNNRLNPLSATQLRALKTTHS